MKLYVNGGNRFGGISAIVEITKQNIVNLQDANFLLDAYILYFLLEVNNISFNRGSPVKQL
jgi:hypothetical protein